MDGLEYASLMRLQIFVGLGMILGTLVFGFIIVKNSSECFISRQYLCQTCCLILSIIVFAFSSGVTDYSGYVLFSWIYGFFYGGYSYSLKMFIFEKVRARNFNRAWGFLQFSQSLPSFFGIPITSEYNDLSVLCFNDKKRKGLRRDTRNGWEKDITIRNLFFACRTKAREIFSLAMTDSCVSRV